jgi:phospholipid/cholesterol/gamma-HCH transport system permease protein
MPNPADELDAGHEPQVHKTTTQPKPPFSALRSLVNEAGAPVILLGRLIGEAVREPRGYWGDVRDEMYGVMKKILVPGIFALLGYGMLAATFAVSILLYLGAANRLGLVYLSFIVRETAPFITGTVVAGVVGTSTTSEIGARKIRGELDALIVLGQDPIRLIILPRVIAVTTILCAMNLIGIIIDLAEGLFVVTTLGDTSAASFLTQFMTNISVAEVLGNLFKTLTIGLFIAVICSSKGLRVSSGSEGLGKAVNQAVVVSVLATFVINALFDMILLAQVPQVLVSR